MYNNSRCIYKLTFLSTVHPRLSGPQLSESSTIRIRLRHMRTNKSVYTHAHSVQSRARRYTIEREIFVGAKFHGITSEGTRKNFRSAHRTGRQGAIDIALAAIFTVFIFMEADLSAKIAKFCTTQIFPLHSSCKFASHEYFMRGHTF